ncbi:MAG: AAA family ATPase [Treponema sp.]|nr:AAA family ATPase [Treponema sp.]
MRPRNLDEYIGQDHIVGKGRLLRRAIQADQLTSVIFYGPPGSGKTTLARVIANHTKSNFITLNAVLTGVADIRESIKKAEEYKNLYSRRTILFVDEVHRWNKSQQDALLPWVENGTIILIGATTENPFFEVNKALVSRSRVFQLKGLTQDDLRKAAHQALTDKDRGYGHWNVVFEEGALEHLIETANGDARSLLNALELAVETTPEKWDPKALTPVPAYGTEIYISKETCEESIQKKVVLYDRDGDYHYDIISAFIKSLRGRDPDAAMYWMARMVRAGEDPHFIFRRMLISACEDTGLADPHAISVVESCAAAFDRVGFPEGNYFLAHAALYLSTAPKSNSSMAFFDAMSAVEKEDLDIPNHLRDASRDAEGFGHGAGYLYPHAYRDHWVAQQYLPGELAGRVFYTPTTQGYEGQIRSEVLSRRELQISSILEGASGDVVSGGGKVEGTGRISDWWIDFHFKSGDEKKPENLTFSPKDNQKENKLTRADKFWQSRLESNRAEVLLNIRDVMIKMAGLLRHHRSLVWNADSGLLLWEIVRKAPEGITCGICKTESGMKILEQYGQTLDDLDRPVLSCVKGTVGDCISDFYKNGTIFDRLFYIDPFVKESDINETCESLKLALEKNPGALSESWCFVISQKIPSGGQRISELVKNQILPKCSEAVQQDISPVLEKMLQAENEFFGNKNSPLFSWNETSILNGFESAGFKCTLQKVDFTEKKRITSEDIRKWFDTEKSSYGRSILESVGKEDLQKVVNLLYEAGMKNLFNWKNETCFVSVEK